MTNIDGYPIIFTPRRRSTWCNTRTSAFRVLILTFPVEALEWVKLTEQRNIYQLLPVKLNFDEKFTSMQMIDNLW